MSIINDIYNKCLKIEMDLDNILTTELNKDTKVVNKILEKFNEKMANLENSIQLLENQVKSNNENVNSNYNTKMIIKKIEILKIKQSEYPNLLRNKLKTIENSKMSYFNSDSKDQSISKYLTDEHDSLKKSLKLSKDIESNEFKVLEELDRQDGIMNSVKTKMSDLFSKLVLSNSITTWIINRSSRDKQLLLFLVFITFVIVYITNYYIKPLIRGK